MNNHLPPDPAVRILTRRQVAAMIGCHPRTVDRIADGGGLHRFVFPGRKKSKGFLREEVERLLSTPHPARRSDEGVPPCQK